MATFEIWGANEKDGVGRPLHTVEADRFTIEAGVIVFKDASAQLHAVVLSPGIVVKKVK